MIGALALAAALSTAAVTSSSAPAEGDVPFDPKNYPERSLAESRRADPCSKEPGKVKDTLFSREVAWHGAVRKAAPARRELLRRWTKQIGDPDAAVKYAEEATVSEGRRLEWVSVPEGLLAYLQMDLMPGDRVLLYLVYVGCAEGAPLFAVDEYEVKEQSEAEGADELIRLPPVDGEDPGVLGPREAGVLERGDQGRPLRAAL